MCDLLLQRIASAPAEDQAAVRAAMEEEDGKVVTPLRSLWCAALHCTSCKRIPALITIPDDIVGLVYSCCVHI